MIVDTIEYEVSGFVMRGVIASLPGSDQRPGLLIAHEAAGLSDHTRNIALRAAAIGYAAFAIDYVGEGRILAGLREVTEQIANWVNDPLPLRDKVKAAHQLLAQRDGVDTHRIAGLGYCFGAQALVDYARTGASLAAVAGIHPGMSVNRVAESRSIRAPMLMCVGADDPLTTLIERQAFEAEMTEAGASGQMLVYGGVGHSFTNPSADLLGIVGIGYDRRADSASWQAVHDFYRSCGLHDGPGRGL